MCQLYGLQGGRASPETRIAELQPGISLSRELARRRAVTSHDVFF